MSVFEMNMKSIEKSEVRKLPGSDKKKYVTPELTKLGSINELIKSGSSLGVEASVDDNNHQS